MPLPAVLNALATWSQWHTTQSGPFLIGSVLYAALPDGTNNVVRVWKSTDGGNTWVEPATSRPTITATTGSQRVAATAVGTKIHVAYPAPSTAAITYAIYDTATDAWNTPVSSTFVANSSAQAGSTGIYTIAVKANNDVVICYSGAATVSAVSYARTLVICYTASLGGSAAWSAAAYDVQAGSTTINTVTATNFDLRAVGMIADSLVVAFSARSTTAGTLTLRALTFSGSTVSAIGTAVNVVTTADTTPAYVTGQMSTYTLAGSNYVIFCRTNKTSASVDSNLLFHRYTVATTTLTAATGNGTTISDSTTNGPDYANSGGAVAYDPQYGVHHAVWVQTVTQDIVRGVDSGIGIWGATAGVLVGGAVAVTGLSITIVTNTAVGVLYTDNGSVTYDQYAARVAPPCRILSQAVKRAAYW